MVLFIFLNIKEINYDNNIDVFFVKFELEAINFYLMNICLISIKYMKNF